MRSFSTPESALKGEITKLGIIECALAVAVYVAIALRLHTVRHFYLAITIAPLTLFRTEESTLWTLRAFEAIIEKLDLWTWQADQTIGKKFDRLLKRTEPDLSLGGTFFIAIFFVIIPALIPVLRVVGTVWGFARRPVRTIAEMPRNWVRQTFCTDLAHPPEAMPGELTNPGEFPTFRRALQYLDIPILFPVAILLFLPPLLYRISFKATAVVYAPFLWVAQATAGSPIPIKSRLERVTKGELEKVRRWLALFVLGVFGVVASLHFAVIDLTSVTSKFPTELAAVNLIGVTKSFQWWHATLLADALLTFWLFFFADAALARMDTQVWSEPFVANMLSMTSFFRGALAVLTMTRFCWLAILNVVPAGVRAFLSML